jgi:hypothetical protein
MASKEFPDTLEKKNPSAKPIQIYGRARID